MTMWIKDNEMMERTDYLVHVLQFHPEIILIIKDTFIEKLKNKIGNEQLEIYRATVNFISGFDVKHDDVMLIVRDYPFMIYFLKNINSELLIHAVTSTPSIIVNIENPIEEIQLIAVRSNGLYIHLFKNPSMKVIQEAVNQNIDVLKKLSKELYDKYMEANDNISTVSGLTESEENVIKALVEAFNLFSKLPVQRTHDLQEFIVPLHQLQRLVAIRAMRRQYPDFWLSSNIKKENIKDE